jgi:hypothetical protein
MIVKCMRPIIVLAGLMAVSGHAYSACAVKPAAVDAAIATSITAVKTNDSAALLAQMSREGVAFGTDGPLIAYASLQTQFSGKTGRYCDLFVCGAAAPVVCGGSNEQTGRRRPWCGGGLYQRQYQ